MKELKALVDMVDGTHLATKSDRQLETYDRLSSEYKLRYTTMTDEERIRYYPITKRMTKLNWEQVMEIRKKYQPYVYGKARLAEEFNVSTSVVYRILKGKSWKI
jgi:hypothetical protein